MTAFKNTIFGKILTGAAKVVLPVVGAVTGIGAIAGIVKGVGAISGIGSAVKTATGGIKAVIDKVGASAVNLVTGTTQAEREQVKAVKEVTKAEADKWEQVDRLVKAGATREQAMATVGVSEPKLTEYQGLAASTVVPKSNLLIYAGVGLAALLILPKLLKGR